VYPLRSTLVEYRNQRRELVDFISLLSDTCASIGGVSFVATAPLFGALVGYATFEFAKAVGVKL